MAEKAGPPTENTSLVGGKGGPEDEKTPAEKMQTAGSIVFLVAVAVLKTQLTAFLFSSSNFPTAYSLWSCVVTDLLLVPFFVTGVTPFCWPTRDMAKVLTLIIIFTASDLAFTNIALANISTALQQCIASTNPFWTLMIETVLYRRCQHPVVYATVILVVIGTVFSTLGSITNLNVFGLISAVVAVLSSACKYVFTHTAFREFKKEMNSFSLLFWVDLLITPIYLVWTLISGELVLLFEDMFSTQAQFWQSTLTAALGGVRAVSQYFVLALVTATSMSTANMTTQVLNILISIPIQHTNVTPFLVIGICVTICSSVFYAFIKAHKPFLPWFDETLGCAPKPTPRAGSLPAA